MTLENLLKISCLEAIPSNGAQIARLIAAAERNLADAAIESVSNENRFDAAYKAIMQVSMAALNAHGYRTVTSKPGHHQTALQSLCHAIALPQDRLITLDSLRKQRNLSDYSGDIVTTSAMQSCIAEATLILEEFKRWLRGNRSEPI